MQKRTVFEWFVKSWSEGAEKTKRERHGESECIDAWREMRSTDEGENVVIFETESENETFWFLETEWKPLDEEK